MLKWSSIITKTITGIINGEVADEEELGPNPKEVAGLKREGERLKVQV